MRDQKTTNKSNFSLIQKLKNTSEVIFSGKSLIDKFVISTYFLSYPLKLLGVNRFLFIFKDLYVKTDNNIFFCRKGKTDFMTVISEKEIKKHFNLDKGIFIDIGAHIGKYTMMFSKKLSKKEKVIAIEPHLENYNTLLYNIKLNKCNNVISLNCAVGDKEGFVCLYYPNENMKSNTASFSTIKKSKVYGRVKVKTIDKILKELKIKEVHLIKIDVEGAEPGVLRGMKSQLKNNKPKIIFEALTKEIFKECENILNRYDYKIKQLDRTNFLAEKF